MTTIGILGAGQVGRTLARASVMNGYDVVIANSRGPETLAGFLHELGPRARGASPAEAAERAAFAIIAFRYTPQDRLPVDELAGKVVLDTNNYMAARDGIYPEVSSGRKTVHELRQEQLPTSKIAKAFSHVQHHPPLRPDTPDDALPGLFRLARPAGATDRRALVVSSNHLDAVDLVTDLYDQFGYDTVDNSPLSESWRSAAGTPMWQFIVDGQSREELILNLKRATRFRR
ncbi:NADPH-dependent F420 reductase [Actinoplanes sp. NPDC049265]|uniref:NADPH-dependent F420 reductase n=1 Tax=Actinoplanes sp. NPDC049265 TaxID=3363902 RepID=UPI00372477BA